MRELVPVPLPSLQRAGIHLPVFVTAGLWDRFIVPPPTAEEQSRSRRMALLLAVLRSVLGQIPPGRDAAAFSFQVKNRPLYWDTIHAWVAVQVEQPGGAPALVVGCERCDEGGPA